MDRDELDRFMSVAPPPVVFALRLAAFQCQVVLSHAVAASAPRAIAGLRDAYILGVALRAGFEHPEWGQGVIRMMKAHEVPAAAVDELLQALPVSMVAEPEVER